MNTINRIKNILGFCILIVMTGRSDTYDQKIVIDVEKTGPLRRAEEPGYRLLEYISDKDKKYLIPVVDGLARADDKLSSARGAEPEFEKTDGFSMIDAHDPLWEEMWGWRATGLEQAWPLSVGEGVIVAIIDTGCDPGHPDLTGSFWINTIEKSGVSGFDDDGNGYIDDINGYDFVSVTGQALAEGEDGGPRDADTDDTNGHGTHVAGIIGAVAGNGLGIEGVAPRCRLMILRAAYTEAGGAGALLEADVAAAIKYAVDMGADVINMSFGGQYSEVIYSEIRRAAEAGIVLVASAGNNGTGEEVFPASCPETISIGAMDTGGRPAIFSSCVPGVDCLAPGVSVISTVPGGYATKSGTSTAAPFVSGTAALLLSGPRAVPVEMVRGKILAGCIPADPGGQIPYGCSGSGQIRADLSLEGGARFFVVPAGAELVTDEISDRGTYPPGRIFNLTISMINLLEPIEGGSIRIEPDRAGVFLIGPDSGERIYAGTGESFEIRYELTSLVPLDEGERLGFGILLDAGEKIQIVRIDRPVPVAPLYTCGAVRLAELTGNGNGAADPGERVELQIEICGPENGGPATGHLDLSGVSAEGGVALASEAVLDEEGRALLRFEFVIEDMEDPVMDPALPGPAPLWLPLSIEGEEAVNMTEIPLWVSYRGDVFTADPAACYQGGGDHTGAFPDGPGPGLEVRWYYEIPGEGSMVCQPVVSERGVFAARREGESCVVYAVDRVSGELLWRTRLPGECRSAPGSMLWSGGVLFVPSGRYLFAVDCETGATVWSQSGGGEERQGYVAGEPAGGGEVVVCTFHSPEAGAADIVMAMDRLTGTLLWSDPDHEMVYGSAPPAFDGAKVIVSDLTGRMKALNAVTGSRLWTNETGISSGLPPVIFSGLVVLCGGGGSLGGFLLEDGTAQWVCETGAIPLGPPCLSPDGMITVIVRTGLVSGLLQVGRSGAVNAPPVEIEGYGFSGIVTGGGMIFAGREEGRLGIYSPAGETIAEVKVAKPDEAAVQLPFIRGKDLYLCVNTNGSDILAAMSSSPGPVLSAPGRIANHPNPFNPSTTIRFSTDSGGHVRLRLFDAAGRLVRSIVDEFLPAGPMEYIWDGLTETGRTASSGVFFAMLECPDGTFTHKIVLLK